MKITKKQLKKIIKEELAHTSLGAGRGPEEVYESASESLHQAHKDLQLLSLLLKNAKFDAQPAEDLIKTIEQSLMSLDGTMKQDVRDLVSSGGRVTNAASAGRAHEGLNKKQSAEEWEKMKDAGDPKRKGTTDVFSKKQLKQTMNQNKPRGGK